MSDRERLDTGRQDGGVIRRSPPGLISSASDRALVLLEEMEWGVSWLSDHGECPWCGRSKGRGEHTHDCKLAEIIGATRQEVSR